MKKYEHFELRVCRRRAGDGFEVLVSLDKEPLHGYVGSENITFEESFIDAYLFMKDIATQGFKLEYQARQRAKHERSRIEDSEE